MRLVRITLRDFRGITASTVDFGDGVTVVEGPNEVGKSSIAEAIRLLRTMKASSKHRDVSGVQPVGRDVGPFAELELRTGGYDLVYRKRWLKGPLTELELRAPKHEQLSGDAAHDRFNAILADTVDADLLAALDVAQGASLDRPDLARVTALQRALDESSGEFEGHDALVASIEAEYARYFTPTGRPSGEYRAAEQALESARAQVETLRAASDELDRFVDDHARRSATLHELDDRLTEARADVEAFEERTTAIAELRRAAEQAARELADAERAQAAAVEARQARADEIAELERRTADLDERASAVAELDEARQAAEERLEGATTTLSNAEEALESARAAAVASGAALRRQRERTERTALAERVANVRAIAERQRSASAARANASVDDGAVTRLGELATELRVAERTRDAATASVRITPHGTRSVTVDGTRIPGGELLERPVRDTIRIELPDVLSVEVVPGTPPADLDRRVDAARDALDAALRDAGVESIDDAVRIAERRRRADDEVRAADAELRIVLGGDAVERLEERLAVLVQRATDDEAAADEADATVESLEADDEGAIEAERAARTAVDEARTAVEAGRTANATAREAWVRETESLASAGAERKRLAERLEEHRVQHDDAALEEAVTAAEAVVGERREAVEAADAALAAEEPETLDMERNNAAARLTSVTADREKTRSEVDRLRGLIDDRTATGIYDRMSAASSALEAAETTAARLTRAATAARLLLETVRRHRDEAQARYVAPFTERIDKLGRYVFGPGFGVTVTPDLVIESRTLDGTTVPFESLSGGAREQLALIGRLACAQLVDPDEGAPVVLDDALGFADPERLRALNVVLGEVGRTAQVVLLTCRPERFAGVGGAEVVRLTPS